LKSNRRIVDPDGIFMADVVFVPLEDGDRTIALKKMNKKVITVDLNPLSRTSTTSDISIVDNVVRSIPHLIKYVEHHKKNSKKKELPIKMKRQSKHRISGSRVGTTYTKRQKTHET